MCLQRRLDTILMITLHASCRTVYCNRSCLFVGVFLGLLPRLLEIACIDPHQTEFVGKGSDHLQLIKFWPSRTPGAGVYVVAKIFGSALLQPACSVCVSSECFFFHFSNVLHADLVDSGLLVKRFFLFCNDLAFHVAFLGSGLVSSLKA